MKEIINLFTVLTICWLNGCAIRQKTEMSFSPSDLNTRASFFNGKTVLVKGYISLMPEDHTIYESKALDAEATRLWNSHDKGFNALSFEWSRYCLTIANPSILYRFQDKFNNQTITLKGKFVDDYLNSQTIDLGACPLPTAIFIDYGDLQRRYPRLLEP